MPDSEYYNRYSDNRPLKEKADSSAVLSIAKVFGYMFIGLMITALITLGLGYYFGNVLLAETSSDIEVKIQETNVIILLVALGISFIGIIVLSFVVPIVAIRGKHSVLVPAIIYSVLMGVMLSTLTIFIDWLILGVTFGITSLVFGLMALIDRKSVV